MLKWADILQFADQGNPAPDLEITKSDVEWHAQFNKAGSSTKPLFDSERHNLFEQDLYACASCEALLFGANVELESGTGGLFFSQPIFESAVAYHNDDQTSSHHVDASCNYCGAHLGQLSPDGPKPSGLRYCIDELVLEKVLNHF
jgi:peptide methionine sulfoxide reductase MsrB